MRINKMKHYINETCLNITIDTDPSILHLVEGIYTIAFYK